MSGGRRANDHGKTAEHSIGDLLMRLQYDYERQAYVGQSVFGKRIVVDFLVKNAAEFPAGFIIESKYQDMGGSVDEKYAYVWMNIVTSAYRYPIIVVCFRPDLCAGAVRFLREQVDGQRFIGVFDFAQLMSWLQRHAHPRTEDA